MSLSKGILPLLIDDISERSIVNPGDWIRTLEKIEGVKAPKLPKNCILTFDYMRLERELKIYYKSSEIRFLTKPVYVLNYDGLKVCYASGYVGSAGCSFLEELMSLGVKNIIVIGGVGVLNPEIERGDIIIPVKALRDEGVSYHYLKPSVYIFPDAKLVEVSKTLEGKGVKLKVIGM